MIARIRDGGVVAGILPLSNTTGQGMDDFQRLLAPGRTFCLLGSSGVGKTTLINRMIGGDALETKPVSQTGEGVHTTARRHLLVLDGGAMMVDTPGMRELGLLGAGDGVAESFAEISALSPDCRFSDCTHTQEPGCAVLAALERGDLGRDRYESYLKLRKESEFLALSYVEKREKDRAFGRFIKSAMKQIKK
jgi:ribosome biogenesis GTPase